jgi:hypothetical protein
VFFEGYSRHIVVAASSDHAGFQTYSASWP